jgi:hypothetical protein
LFNNQKCQKPDREGGLPHIVTSRALADAQASDMLNRKRLFSFQLKSLFILFIRFRTTVAGSALVEHPDYA